ncbi:MAG: hypothetical protein IJR52_08155 [Selenomonadaceae bacterium]|nr:hypothetical protein [Selenomonadaceae bacterium]
MKITLKEILVVVLLGVAIFAMNYDDDENLSSARETSKSAQASPVAKNIPNFTAKTTDGEKVTEEIFADKKSPS